VAGYDANLDAYHSDQLLDGGGRLLKRGVLFRCELDFDDLLDAARAELHGDSDVQALDAVFAFEIGGAGQNFLAGVENGVNHFHHRR